MPFKFEPGKNPFVETHFAKLSIGTGLVARQVAQLSKQLQSQAKTGKVKIAGKGRELDETEIGAASTQLRDIDCFAEELLLTHVEPPRTDAQIESAAEQLRSICQIPRNLEIRSLAHPLMAFWFVPEPTAEALALPDWNGLGLGSPDELVDLDLDIVFDQ